MPLANAKELLTEARRRGCCIGGFDVFNLELLEAVLQASEELRSPVVAQVSFMNFDFYRERSLIAALRAMLERCAVPAVLHLDHGPKPMEPQRVRRFLDLGFTSVMVDGSHLPLAENIALMRRVVSWAAPYGASVEGELGQVSRDPQASKAQIHSLMTNPVQAGQFAAESGVDFLAVSVGSISSCFDSRKIDLDLERLAAIAARVPIPLVFHGGTSIPDQSMRLAISLGVAKVNVAHGLRKAFLDAVRSGFHSEADYIDPRPTMAESIDAVRGYVTTKIRLFGSVGLADAIAAAPAGQRGRDG